MTSRLILADEPVFFCCLFVPRKKKTGLFLWVLYFFRIFAPRNVNMILNRKYPNGKVTWLDCLLYAAIVFLVLYLLKPFGLNNKSRGLLLTCLLFGIVTFVAQVVFWWFANRLSRKVAVWRVWHECLRVFCLILFIALCNYVFDRMLGGVSLFNLPALLLFLRWTFALGIFITAIAIIIGYNRSLRTQLASMIEKNSEEQEAVQVCIHDTAVRGSDLVLPINDLLYAESSGNDMVIYYRRDGKLQSQSYRMTMAQLLQELPFPNIIQCHRSFVVNVNNVTDARGNSNGYTLRLEGCSASVPVSRSFVPKLKSFLS